MDNITLGWIGLVVLFTILAFGIPLGIGMGLVGFLGFVIIAGLPSGLSQLATTPYAQVASYTLTVIPLFIVMGELAYHGGLIRGAYDAAQKFIGHWPGGLAMATVMGCAAFGAICGSGIATASTMTSVAYPEMKRYNYHPSLSLGSIACGGNLGVLIPPSTPLIIYSLFAQESIGKLFMAGIVPGVILTALFMLGIYIWTRIDPNVGPASSKSTWIERVKALLKAWPVIILAVFVLGGIYLGVFSPTEAAGVGAFGALVIGLALRTLTLQKIYLSLSSTTKATAMIFVILIGAMIFNYFIVMTGIPAWLATFVEGLAISHWIVLMIILVIYLVLGCIMDTMAMTVLTLPIFLPVLTNLGFDAIWFGVIFIVMSSFATITPPVGMNVFVVSGMVRDVPMYTIFRGIVPFLIAMVVLLLIIIPFPQTVLLIPNLMSK
jgi:C4-dicarboxylate transporter, DctM subunit